MAGRLLTKKLTYRDATGRDRAFHAAHWRGFTWQAGSTIVSASGPWGQVQVWAASEAEGRRVIAHAADAGGLDLTGPSVVWLVHSAAGTTRGRTATMKTRETFQGVEVTKRSGPAGTPEIG